MTLQALTGQLYILNGASQDSGDIPGVTAHPSPGSANRSRTQDKLFIHLSLSGQPDETELLAHDLVDAISNRFYQSAGSVTSALRKAMLDANQLLFQYNMANSGESRQGALTLAVQRDYDLYMVQTGEALALIGRNFGVEKLPPTKPEHLTPLGRSAGIDIRFFHNMLEPGDKLLLADPRLGHLSSDIFESALVDLEMEPGLARLAELVGPGTGRLLLIEFSDDPLDDMPETGGRGRIAEQPRNRPIGATRPNINVEQTARRATAETARGLSRLTGGFATLLARFRPAEPNEFDDRKAPIALPTLLALLIPIIVGVVVTGVYLQRNIEQQLGERQQAMNELIALADVTGEPAIAREYYLEVIRLADEADTIRRGDGDVLRLRLAATAGLDRIEGVQRLNARTLFTHASEADLQSVIFREGLNGGIFALDAVQNIVYYYPTDESYSSMSATDPEVIFFGGESIAGATASTMLDLLWRPGGANSTQSSLAVLDLNTNRALGAVLTYVPSPPLKNYISLGLSSDWGRPVAMTSYSERLYILDQSANVVWRYFPEGESYVMQDDDRTVDFLNAVDLTQAVDLDIYDQDANIVLVHDDGRMQYFDSRTGRVLWDEASLGLAEPLVAPVAVKVVGTGLNASIFVLDPGSGRIVQLSRAGTILAQFRATDSDGLELFSNAADFAVVENPLRIVTVAGQSLYLTSFGN